MGINELANDGREVQITVHCRRSIPRLLSSFLTNRGIVLNREFGSRQSRLMSPADRRTIEMPAGAATSRSRRSSAA
jgi:phage baseplate assembly protein W